MAGVNKAILVGNLGADPEIRYSASGLAITKFNIATSEKRKNKEGERETQTEWHRVVAFGKLAEICGEYLAKGKQVYLEGRIKTQKWEDKEGNTRYTTEIIADQMQMLGSVGDKPRNVEGAPPPSGDKGTSEPPDFEDIPF